MPTLPVLIYTIIVVGIQELERDDLGSMIGLIISKRYLKGLSGINAKMTRNLYLKI
jgi:hypothetical protein